MLFHNSSLVAATIVGLSLVASTGCRNTQHNTPTFAPAAASTPYTGSAAAASHTPESEFNLSPSGIWTCPMHPHVKRTGVGKCPECGMDLVRKPKENTNSPPSSSGDSFYSPPATPTRSKSSGSSCCG